MADWAENLMLANLANSSPFASGEGELMVDGVVELRNPACVIE